MHWQPAWSFRAAMSSPIPEIPIPGLRRIREILKARIMTVLDADGEPLATVTNTTFETDAQPLPTPVSFRIFSLKGADIEYYIDNVTAKGNQVN